MTVEQLLNALEQMTHTERIARMIAIGRDAARYKSEIAELRKRGVYERMLALYTCYTSQDNAHVFAAVNDESRMIRKVALKLLARVGDDAQVRQVLSSLHKSAKLAFSDALTKQKNPRTQIINAYIEESVESGALDEARLLLGYASESVVQRHIDLLGEGHIIEWARIARHHPALILSALHARAQNVRQTDYWMINAVNATIRIFLQYRVTGVIPLIQTLMRRLNPNQLYAVLQTLVPAYPAEMAAIALESKQHLSLNFDGVVDRVGGVDTIRALIEQDYVSHPQNWLERLLPAQRDPLYERFANGWRTQEGILSTSVVALLNRDDREEEGARHLELPALQTRIKQRVAYASFLPWDQARAAIDPILRNPDPELRIAAIGSLISTVRYHRDRAADLLTILKARKNEQDPVRLAIFMALVNLPAGLWKAEHLDDLGQLIRDALNAADLSRGTGTTAESLVIRLLPFHPRWAADWLATLMKERGEISSYRLEDKITERAMERIRPALVPVLRSWETRERQMHLLSLARSFGRRITGIPELADMLERLVTGAVLVYNSVHALGILDEHFEERTARLIPALINEDKSWATQPTVYNHLHERRQDLLTPFLGQNAYKGRFSTGNTYFVLPFTSGFHRWTTTQQTIFHRTLSSVGSDLERDTPAIIRSIRQLTGLMYVPPMRLLMLIEDKRLPIRDTALRALGRVDGSEGVVALLGVMGDDRARIAIYALRSAMLQMSPQRTLDLLAEVPLEKVTVAKEVVRLVGEMQSEAAYQKLLEMNTRDLHRDVQVALLRGFWTHLDRDETWTILDMAAESTDPAVATMAGRTMSPSRSGKVERRLIRLLIKVMAHPDPQVRVDVLTRLGTQTVHDADRALAEPLLERLLSVFEDEVRAAAGAFSAYARQDAELAREIMTRLLPRRRTLQIVFSVLTGTFWAGNEEVRAAARAILSILSTDPLTIQLQMDLVGRVYGIDTLADLITNTAAANQLHAEAMLHAKQVIPLHQGMRTPDAARIEAKWSGSANPFLRRIGLAVLVGMATSPAGWTMEQRTILEQYRADPDPMVASAAQFTFPPEPDTRPKRRRVSP